MNDRLDPGQRQALLVLARDAITAKLEGRPPPNPGIESGLLSEPRAVFVTLTLDGMLRGCIGHVEPVEPVWSSVRSNAVAAAFRDPRVSPLTLDELDRINIEISVMSPLERLRDPSSIVVGVHGLMIERGAARGLLLPQVPMEWQWSREEFFINVCRKAGLPDYAWKHGAKLYSFRAEVFGEGTVPGGPHER